MPNDDTTVFIVDDDSAVRRSVSRLVRAVGWSAETFSSPEEFLREELPEGPTCVVLDMQMEGLNGLDVQDALRERPRQVPIVFLSGHGSIPTAAASIKHGADDFLEKPVRPKELIESIRKALEHDRARRADWADRREITARYETLTPREREVLELVVSGLLNKQSAAELGISEKTIKVHRARVMEKMGVESLAELVRLAERIDIPSRAVLPAPAALEPCSTQRYC